jgi:hypothetical protein
MPFPAHSSFRFSLLTLAAVPLLVTTGCGFGTADTSATGILPSAISGIAHGGHQPIIGATVTLYAAGKTAYGSAPTPLGTSTTLAPLGSFSIVPNSNTCSDPDQLYLVVAGGDSGAGTNAASVLVQALGNCSTATSLSGLDVDEVTTVAAAYTLAQFASVDGSSVNIGVTSTNSLGLQHAFLNAANLANYNGSARTSTVGGNGTVPNGVINSLANSLASCVDSTGTGSTGCNAIFVAPPTGVSTGTPANTWQAALNWALYPGNNTAGVYANQTPTSPFLPDLSSAPDLTIGIAYFTGYKSDGVTKTDFPWDIKADAGDNIWVTGESGAGLVELSSAGTVLSPNGGWGSTALQTASIRGVAFDNLSPYNVWLGDTAGNVWAYNPTNNTSTKVALPTSINVNSVATTVAASAVPVAVDSSNNVWYATYASTATATQTLGEVPSGTFAAQTTFAYSPLFPESTKGAYSMTVDAANNFAWAGSQSAGHVYTFNTGVTAAAASSIAVAATNAINTIAQDGNGNTWVVYQGSGADKGVLYKYSSTSPSSTPTSVAGPSGASAGLYNPRGLAIDGIGRLFVISFSTPAAVVEYDPSLTTSSTPTGYLLNSASNGFAPVDNTGTTILVGSGPRNATIDATGSLWLSNGTAANQPGAVQIFGIAAPATNPLSKGVYSKRP